MKIYVAHRNERLLVAIDAVNDEVVGRITGLGLILEQPRYNAGDGYVYQISGDDNVIYRIDPNAGIDILLMIQLLPMTTDLGGRYATTVHQAFVEDSRAAAREPATQQ